MNPALRAELHRLTPADRFTLLGELLEPSLNSPFDHDFAEEDAVTDALMPVLAAFSAAYDDVRAVLDEAVAGPGRPVWCSWIGAWEQAA